MNRGERRTERPCTHPGDSFYRQYSRDRLIQKKANKHISVPYVYIHAYVFHMALFHILYPTPHVADVGQTSYTQMPSPRYARFLSFVCTHVYIPSPGCRR